MGAPQPNDGKNLLIDVKGRAYARIPVKTHVVELGEDVGDIVQRYTRGTLQEGDVVFISEKIVAISQRRAFSVADIQPTGLARFLCRFVHKSPHGVGLRNPWTMQLAIQEVGVWRILFAAFAAAVTKPFGMKGVFYRVSGRRVAAIDGPTDDALPPYDGYAILAPLHTHRVATAISERVGVPVVIVDANDIGVEVLGASPGAPETEFIEQVLRDNPLGQSDEQTPVGIIREAAEDTALRSAVEDDEHVGVATPGAVS